MEERLHALESVIQDLRHSITLLETRIAAIEATLEKERGERKPLPIQEAAGDGSAIGIAKPLIAAPKAPPFSTWRDPVALLSLLGRLFIVLGGAFLLRAMTDNGVVAPGTGVAMGFCYGMIWLFFSLWAGSHGKMAHAVFHGLATVLVAYPLLWETTTRFKVLDGIGSAVALALLTGSLLVSACWNRVQILAWITVIVSLPTTLVLLIQTGILVPYSLFLIGFGIASLWIGYSLDWFVMRWPVAFMANVTVLGITLRALEETPRELPAAAIVIQMILLFAYLGSIAVRTLIKSRDVVIFEVVQSLATLAIGFGGAAAVANQTGYGSTMVGWVSLVLGFICSAAALAFLDIRQNRPRNVYFYTSLALVYMVFGLSLISSGTWMVVSFLILGMLSCLAWMRYGHTFLLLHTAAYLLAAGVASRTLGYCLITLLGLGDSLRLPLDLWNLVTCGIALFCFLLITLASPAKENLWASLLKAVIILLTVWMTGGLLVGFAAPILAAANPQAVDIGGLATLRTGVFALAALLLGWLGGYPRFRECRWFVYPLLVVTGIKMVVDDFPHSRPSTLFLASAIFGIALIFAPRLPKRNAGRLPANEV